MEIFDFGFLKVRLLDIIDVLIVAFLLYKVYEQLKGGVAIRIFIGLIAIYALWGLCVRVLDMKLMGALLGQFIGVGVIALIIVFQQEVRSFLIMLGTNQIFNRSSITSKWIPWKSQYQESNTISLSPILQAVTSMASSRTGALIVIGRLSDLTFYIDTGDRIDARISQRLIESIFYKNSPLHDGAMMIVGGKIKAVRCVLPVTEQKNLPANLGMRHRAGIGLSENSDAISIMVSEQTGKVSTAIEGKLYDNLSAEELEKKLQEAL